VGLPIPSVRRLARQRGISPSTAQRAVQLLSQWGLVRIEPGTPTVVASGTAELGVGPTEVASDSTDKAVVPQPLELEVRRLGVTVATLRTQADPKGLDVERGARTTRELDRKPAAARVVALWCMQTTFVHRNGAVALTGGVSCPQGDHAWFQRAVRTRPVLAKLGPLGPDRRIVVAGWVVRGRRPITSSVWRLFEHYARPAARVPVGPVSRPLRDTARVRRRLGRVVLLSWGPWLCCCCVGLGSADCVRQVFLVQTGVVWEQFRNRRHPA
jgi:hypothetical protein